MKKFLFLFCLLCTIMVRGQNVGIGTQTPAALLHLKSPGTSPTGVEMLRIESGSPYVSFFDNTGIYSGYIWYNQTSNRLEFGTPSGSGRPVVIAPNLSPSTYFTANGRVGLGNSSPTERLDVNGNINTNGNINITGLLKVDGSAGNAGQVLTSNGTSSPQWRNAPYSNTTRFFATFRDSPDDDDEVIYTLVYNVNPFDVIIGANEITINRTGLYHFEFHLTSRMSFEDDQPDFHRFSHGFRINGQLLEMDEDNPGLFNRRQTAVTIYSYTLSAKYSVELHVLAPTTLNVWRTLEFNAGPVGRLQSRGTSGWITGYLISE